MPARKIPGRKHAEAILEAAKWIADNDCIAPGGHMIPAMIQVKLPDLSLTYIKDAIAQMGKEGRWPYPRAPQAHKVKASVEAPEECRRTAEAAREFIKNAGYFPSKEELAEEMDVSPEQAERMILRMRSLQKWLFHCGPIDTDALKQRIAEVDAEHIARRRAYNPNETPYVPHTYRAPHRNLYRR